MGTRNLTIVLLDNEIKIAQYCQWDGYPTGQGRTIAEFIHKFMDLNKLKEKVRALTWATNEDINAKWEECGADGSGMVSFDTAEVFKEKYPHLSRDCGAAILRLVQDGVYEYRSYHKHLFKVETIERDIQSVKNDLTFASDSLFCEYTYLIDLDNEQVEVYEGFNETYLDDSERFAYLGVKGGKYQPIKLATIVPFNEFTEDNMQALEDYLNGETSEKGSTTCGY